MKTTKGREKVERGKCRVMQWGEVKRDQRGKKGGRNRDMVTCFSFSISDSLRLSSSVFSCGTLKSLIQTGRERWGEQAASSRPGNSTHGGPGPADAVA